MKNIVRKFTVLIIFTFLVMCFCFLQSNRKVIAKDIRLSTESLNIENARPENINGIIYIPLRNIFEALGWEVSWDGKVKTVVCTNGTRVIRFKADSEKVDIDDRYYIMSGPLTILDSKSYVPQRFITEEFGLKVRWNKKDNIIITSDKDTTSITVNGSSNIVIVGDSLIVNIFEPYNIHTISDMISYSDRLLASNNEEEALHKYKEILDNISKEEEPEIYAHVMSNLANAYSKLSESKDTKSNILCAIGYYHEAIGYYRDNDDANYSIILNNLGSAYRILSDITGNSIFLAKALIHYQEALQYYPLSRSDTDYALIQYNLGKTYYDLGMPNLAKECFVDAKDVFLKPPDLNSSDTNPSYYAAIQFHLGIINNILEELCPLEEECNNYVNNFEEADIKGIDNFNKALKVWTAESYPLNYAKVHECLGKIYTSYYERFGNVEYLTMAEKEYEEAIEFYSAERHPFPYAVANYELGNLKLLLQSFTILTSIFLKLNRHMKTALKFLIPRIIQSTTLKPSWQLKNRKT
ncbi:stalk domain-containing protein [Acetivibrio straminisolvens]|uniref:FOG protein containing TPR repeat n=1 Tax=Acetivibrio straminisolvens JCM 21531 TaxID=1294263 RepID=W4V623_9FIRM|nr:stalk domain-containing protein [Acetivibrio straminisolvens]GAE88263.1 FOG protein containing TPR repeat [Acetivibrio straminisolvens JCM 21531]